jgi:uncharacterized protein YdaU (DUF1376 family)
MRTGHLMARRFWYPRDPSAFLMATAHYDLETKGAYSTLIDLLNERDRPLPNEDRFISGILGCSPQKWRKIRDLLLRDGKIVLNSEGQITNPRYEREAKARGIEHAKAVEDGRKGGKISAARRAGQAELDLDAGFDDEPENPNNGKRVAKDSQKSCNSFQTPSRNPEEKPNEINGTPQPPPQAPRARENQNQKLYSPPISSSGTNALDRPDLHALMERVCEAAGYRPMNPTQISRSLAFVEDMVKNEIDFDETVIPVVEAEMAKSKEPTRTLGRFRDAILHQQARSKASRKQGQKPPPSRQAHPRPRRRGRDLPQAEDRTAEPLQRPHLLRQLQLRSLRRPGSMPRGSPPSQSRWPRASGRIHSPWTAQDDRPRLRQAPRFHGDLVMASNPASLIRNAEADLGQALSQLRIARAEWPIIDWDNRLTQLHESIRQAHDSLREMRREMELPLNERKP